MYLKPQARAETKLCDMVGVREHSEGGLVELWRNKNGRLIIRAYNERGNNITDVDLWDLLDWLRSGPGAGLLVHSEADESSRRNSQRN
jgi:hypothetical protein